MAVGRGEIIAESSRKRQLQSVFPAILCMK